MADYVMLEDIFLSTDNMEIIRNNSQNDDGTDTLLGVEWFKFRGVTASNFYISGNSWIGIGQNAEQIKISRRDADVFTTRREEGTLLNTYKFIRFRWEGYSVHGNFNDSTRLIWDAVFFDTGDIILFIDTISDNSSNLGEFAFYTKTKTISYKGEKGKMITFLHQDENGDEFILSENPPTFMDPYNRRYLFRDGEGVLYTVEEDVLKALEETAVTAEVFETYGIPDLPDGNLIIGLHNPSVLYWHDSNNRFPDMKLKYKAIPKPQVIYSENIDMSDYTILGIEKVTADCDEKCLFAVSFDDGENWYGYTNNNWVKFTEEASGMSKAAIEGISTDAWAEKAVTGMIKYRFVLSGADGFIKNVVTDFLNVEA
nr:MAG TPA: hypothetical protein [Caudoviricetes sp.]